MEGQLFTAHSTTKHLKIPALTKPKGGHQRPKTKLSHESREVNSANDLKVICKSPVFKALWGTKDKAWTCQSEELERAVLTPVKPEFLFLKWKASLKMPRKKKNRTKPRNFSILPWLCIEREKILHGQFVIKIQPTTYVMLKALR